MKMLNPPPWLDILLVPEPGMVALIFSKRPADRDEALEELERVDDWRLLLHVLPLAFEAQRDTSARAMDAVKRLFEATPVAQVARLARQARTVFGTRAPYSPLYPGGWMQLSPEDVSRSAAGWDDSLVAMSSLHPSGWVRAAALTELARRPLPRVLPYVLLRATDWVKPLRERAEELCERALSPGNELSWARALPAVQATGRTERGAASALEGRVRAYLRSDAGQAAVENATRSADVTVRRAAWRFVLSEAGPLRVGQLAEGLRDRDAVVSRMLAAHLPSLRGNAEMVPVLRVALRGRQPLLRGYGLDLLAELLGEEAKPEVLAALMDRSALVRGVARHYARERHWVSDFGRYYAERLSEDAPGKVRVALDSLVEERAVAQWPLVRPLLTSENRPQRRAAIAFAVAIDAPESAALLWEALADDEVPTSNFARRMLAARPSLVSAQRAVGVAANESLTDTARLNATRLLPVLGKWAQPPALLTLVATSEGPVTELATELLRRWDENFNRGASQPSADELAAMANALNTARPLLPEPLARALTFSMRPWMK